MIEKIVRKEVELQEGVKLYSVPDARMSDEELEGETSAEVCQNIEVEPGVKTLILGGFDEFFFLKRNKVFPDVEEIHICKDVCSITISHDAFPNVRKVTSDSSYFLDSDMLVRLPDDIADMVRCCEISKKEAADMNRGILENIFHRRPDEVVDLKGIKEISNSCSFSGCETENIINTDNVTSCSDWSWMFPADEQEEYKEDGILGTILVKPYIKPCEDGEQLKYVFPDKKITAIAKSIGLFASTKSWLDVVVIKNESQINALMESHNTFRTETTSTFLINYIIC